MAECDIVTLCNLLAAKNSTKSESTFQQGLALFLLGGALGFALRAREGYFKGAFPEHGRNWVVYSYFRQVLALMEYG